jgi:hypothetical protein
MQVSDPVIYNNISPAQFDFFKNLAKGNGASINGNKDDVTFDLIPVGVEYNSDTKVLTLRPQQPFWLTPGTVTGALHQMVAQAAASNQDPKPVEAVKTSGSARSPEGGRLPEPAPKVYPAGTLQPEAKALGPWTPDTAYITGSQVYGAGYVQQATLKPGVSSWISGKTAPAFSGTAGGTVNEGPDMVWTNTGLAQAKAA